MPHIYTCSAAACQQTIYLDAAAERPWMQQSCPSPHCFGRMEWVRTDPGPVAPQAPAPIDALALNAAMQPRTWQKNGLFCHYTLTYNPASFVVSFNGSAEGKQYDFVMEGYRKRAEFLPATFSAPGLNTTPCSEFFVMNPEGAKDWMSPPNPTPENKGKSHGHGRGLSSPFRIQFGSQDKDSKHSGSGLIHMMFAHQKENLRSVYDILRSVLSPQKIGAIYKTKNMTYGHYRFIFLSRSNTPNCIVSELHADYQRIITLYKLDSIKSYNKFKRNKDDYQLIYSWDKDIY